MMLIDCSTLETNTIITNCYVIYLTIVCRNCQSRVLYSREINNLTCKINIRLTLQKQDGQHNRTNRRQKPMNTVSLCLTTLCLLKGKLRSKNSMSLPYF